MIISEPKKAADTPTRVKRRHSGTLRLNDGPGGESGVAGFPAINNHAAHVLVRVERTTIDDDGGDKCQVLYGRSMNATVVDDASADASPSPIIIVKVCDFWTDSSFPVGCVVRLIAPLKRKEQVYEVNAERGIIITDPHTLLSCTTMAGMTFCPRKTVFSDRFRGAGSSFPMLLGTIVHELFQKCLINRPKVVSRQYLFNEYRIHHIAEVCVELVALGETLAHFEVELMVYLESVSRWMREYAPGRRHATAGGRTVASPAGKRTPLVRHSTTCLDAVVDIEDNVWSPTLGVKGKIDVSFKSYNAPEVIPLELKTGKPHYVEHLSQVMLYSLMYSETMNSGRVAPGFVLYIKNNVIRQIAPKTTELRGILQMRNRVVPYFSRLAVDGFPKPLQNNRMCAYCEHSTTCALVHRLAVRPSHAAAFAKVEVDSETENLMVNDHLFRYDALSAEMEEFLGGQVAHLRDCDIAYAERWLRHILDQWTAAKRSGKMERVFFDTPDRREAGGACLANMRLESTTKTESGKYHLKFVKRDGSNLKSTDFEAGNYVIVSSKRQCALYLHPLATVDERSVTVASDKLMVRTRANDDELYAIDKYESQTHFALRLGNLALLMTDSDRMTRLRSLIIDGRKPQFGTMSKEGRMSFVAVKSQLDPTCKNQGVALMNALKLEDYMLVHGDDDGDRLRTAVLMTQCFLRRGWSVLLTAPSWQSLDAAAAQLFGHVSDNDLLRIAASSDSTAMITDEKTAWLQSLRLEEKMAKLDERKSSEYFDATRSLLMDMRLIMTPCTKVSNQSIFAIRTFDVCVVLDAYQLNEMMLIRPLMQSNAFVLIGNLEDVTSKGEKDISDNLMKRLAAGFPGAMTRLGRV